MAGSFAELLQERFAPLGGVKLRKMFGGVGVFKDGIMFGLVADDVLYLKADETTVAAYETEGCRPFEYEMRGRLASMPYWRLPERLYDEPEDFHAWAGMAFDVARKNRMPEKAEAKKGAPKPAKGIKPRKATASKPKPAVDKTPAPSAGPKKAQAKR